MNRMPPVPSGIAAVRGAVTVPNNEREAILDATARLLISLCEVNGLDASRIVSAIFTVTDDLDADFPAHAARRLGWQDVPLLCAREIPVPGSMPRVVRVLLTVSAIADGRRLTPVYLDGAAALRPDLAPSVEPGRPSPVPGASSRGVVPEAGGGAVRRVAIIGLGQIGGSIGLALGRRAGWRRVGFDLDPGTRDAARAAGAVDEIAESIEEACAAAELAVLATPVDTLPGLIARAAAALPRGAALLDTGSARSGITEALARAAEGGVAAVGGHPLAGSAGRGFAAARGDLFEGSTFALAPVGDAVPECVVALVRDLGARPLRVEADEHDRALARTSHLPYLLADALRTLGQTAAARGLSGPGFRDMTRLAASDPRVAMAYCRANSREVADAWRALRSDLDARVRGLEAP